MADQNYGINPYQQMQGYPQHGCCPNCGYCPHCGRGAAPLYPAPAYPSYPSPFVDPSQPWIVPWVTSVTCNS